MLERLRSPVIRFVSRSSMCTRAYPFGLLLVAWGCSSPAPDPATSALGGAGWGTGGSVPVTGGAPVGGTAGVGGTPGVGGVATGGVPCSPPVSGARVHPGNYDTRGCNSVGCHVGFSGGWLYTDPAGGDWVPDATITLQNPDGTALTATSATDGFFSLIGSTTPAGTPQVPYVPCVSKCPDTNCGSSLTHTALDCQTSNCHGAPNMLIYLRAAAAGTGGVPGAGGTGGTTPGNCVPATPGGPRTHTADLYDTQACQICHDDLYTGGFVYDGVTSTRVVTQATVTLTYPDGTSHSALSGPGGMFYFDGLVSAPYVACVSKCPDTVCSTADSHTTADDCRKCHIESLRIHVP